MELVREKLKSWNMEHLMEVFISEEIDDEAFVQLDYINVCEIIKKTGPRIKFWSKFAAEFMKNENIDGLSTKSTLSNITQPSWTSTSIEIDNTEDLDKTIQFVLGDQSNASSQYNRTVKEFLSHGEGKVPIIFFKAHGKLDEFHRNRLVSIIIAKEFESGNFSNEIDFRISTERFKEITQQIIDVFPTESSSTYFNPYIKETKRKASGKLWEKLQTFKKNLRRSKTPNKVNLSNSTTVETFNIEETNEKLQFLSNYLEPYDKILEFWKHTVEARAQLLKPESNLTISLYVDKFPILKSAEGYKLYKIDFEHYYEENSNYMLQKWPEINARLISIAEKKNKPEIRNLLTQKSNLIGFFLLPHLLSTPVLGKRKLSQTKRNTKLESADSFIIFLTNSAQIKEKLFETRKLLQANKQTLQPTVILVGETQAQISDAYLAIDESLYKCEGPIEAIDACFKSYTALNAKFPESSQHIWTLIQKHIYKITTEWDRNYTTVNSLISDLM